MNAPVNINGGDGFDTVVVIGTEFNDDFVVTPNGVFGAGLNVNFVNIESLEVDGGAGNDRFFILGTSPSWTTTITGGLGSNLFSVMGPTPGNGVISNTLLGHSGIITHDVQSTAGASLYSGLNVVGISANVADNDAPAVVVTQTDGFSQVAQGDGSNFTTLDGTMDSYSVLLSRPPDLGVAVHLHVTPPPGLTLLNSLFTVQDCGGSIDQACRKITDETQVVTLAGLSGGHFTLTLGGETTDPISWDATAPAVRTALEGLTGLAGNVDVQQDGTTYAITFTNGKGQRNIDQMTADLGLDASAGATIGVATTVRGGVSVAVGEVLDFDNTNWWVPQALYFGVDDRVPSIPTNADFQNTIEATSVIGVVAAGTMSVDMNPNTVGDE